MQLRKKTLIIIGLTLVGMILLIYAASQAILMQSYTDIENKEIVYALNSSLSELHYDLSALDSVTVDYAYWDDTYSYVQNDGPGDYIQSSFVDATMLNQKLNAVVITNASGGIIYARGYDPESEADSVPGGIRESLAAGSPLLRSAATGPLHGIIMLPDGPMLISAYPILKSDGKGASTGTMIMGRFLTDGEIGVLRDRSGLAIAMHPYRGADTAAGFEPAGGLAGEEPGTMIVFRDTDTISGYALIEDIYGNPALVLRVDEPRTVYRQAQNALLYIITSLLVSGIVFSLVVSFFLERMVISPMIRLSDSVGRIGLDTEAPARVRVEGNDEVAQLATTINHTLDALGASRQQLHDREQRFRNLVENINDVVWEADADLKLTYVSPQARDVIGYEPDAILGRSPFELVNSDRREHIRAIIHDMIVRKGSFALVEFAIVRPGGEGAEIEVGGNPILDAAGNIVGYRGIARDITERKRAETALRESEERLRLCSATASFGTFDWDIAGDRHLWSPETYEIYGLPPGTPLTLDRITDLIYPGDRKDAALTAGLDPAGPGEYSMEYRIVRASDAAVRWVYIKVRVFFAGEGQERRAVRALGAIQDITERKQAEERMLSSLEEKEVLLKEIHHRVKNNLQIISSLLSLQSENINNENPARTFKEGQDRIRSMALIHEKLYQARDISRIDFGEYTRSLTTYLAHSYMTGPGIGIVIDIQGIFLDIDKAIPCGLIINELVTNSLKYAFPGGRTGEIRISLTCGDGMYVMNVGDNGVGLPPGLDFRNTSSLGLQLVDTLVTQLEGKVELDTSHGAMFRITFADLKPGPGSSSKV